MFDFVFRNRMFCKVIECLETVLPFWFSGVTGFLPQRHFNVRTKKNCFRKRQVTSLVTPITSEDVLHQRFYRILKYLSTNSQDFTFNGSVVVPTSEIRKRSHLRNSQIFLPHKFASVPASEFRKCSHLRNSQVSPPQKFANVPTSEIRKCSHLRNSQMFPPQKFASVPTSEIRKCSQLRNSQMFPPQKFASVPTSEIRKSSMIVFLKKMFSSGRFFYCFRDAVFEFPVGLPYTWLHVVLVRSCR